MEQYSKKKSKHTLERGAAMLAAMGLIWEIAHELREQGTYQKLSQHPDGMSQAWQCIAQ